MKAKQIQEGGKYRAKVNGKLVIVRVNEIYTITTGAITVTRYRVTNLATGRKTTFRSAAKFRSQVTSTP